MIVMMQSLDFALITWRLDKMTESKKVNKGIRISEDAWHIAKKEAGTRCVPMGDFFEAMIRWSCEANNVTCPECEKDFELRPLDYFEVVS